MTLYDLWQSIIHLEITSTHLAIAAGIAAVFVGMLVATIIQENRRYK